MREGKHEEISGNKCLSRSPSAALSVPVVVVVLVTERDTSWRKGEQEGEEQGARRSQSACVINRQYTRSTGFEHNSRSGVLFPGTRTGQMPAAGKRLSL